MDPLVGAAIATGAATLLSSGINYVGSQLTNNSNYEAAKYASDMDYKKWHEYLDYQDPKNQVKRLRAAGMNPSLAMSQGAIDSGNPSSPPPDTRVPQYNYDFSPIAQGIRDSVELYNNYRMQNAQIDNINAQTQNQKIRNNYEDRRQLAELFKIRNEGNLTDKQKELVDSEIEMLGKRLQAFDAQNAADLHLKESQAAEHQSHANLLRAQEKYQNIVNQFAPDQQKKLLRNLDAEYKNILASAYEHNEGAARNHAESAVAKARKAGLDISNEVSEQIIDAQVDKAFYEADEQFYKAQNEGKSFTEGKVGSYLPSERYGDGSWDTHYYSRPPSASRTRKKGKISYPKPSIPLQD